jgi:hypothetical protein
MTRSPIHDELLPAFGNFQKMGKIYLLMAAQLILDQFVLDYKWRL